VIKLKQINLPIFLLGAGLVHLVGLAALLPMLITLPGPGGEIEPKAVVVDVDLVPAAPSSPKVEPDVDLTSALSAVPPGAPAPAEPQDAAPRAAVANVSPAAATSPDEPAADAAAVKEKAKVEGKTKGGKPAKLTRTAPKKSVLSSAKGKSVARRPARPRASSQPPYKGPFSALFYAAPGATGKKRR